MMVSFIFLLVTYARCSHSPPGTQQAGRDHRLDLIESEIYTRTKQHHEPKYSLHRLEHTGLATDKQNSRCQSEAGKQRYELMPSISIYEGEAVSYPAIVKHCHTYYSLKGLPIITFDNPITHTRTYKHFISSTRSEFTYFAEVEWSNDQHNQTVTIKKLQQSNRKTVPSQQTILLIPLFYGHITAFANSFSLSLKLFAFATDLGKLLFYRGDGKLQSSIDLLLYHGPEYHTINLDQAEHQPFDIRITKLNNHIAIYTSTFNRKSFVFTVSTNGKNSTLRKFALPKVQTSIQNQSMILKYNDNNWNQFFLKICQRVYVFQIKASAPQSPITKHFDSPPSLWYSLMTETDQFYIAGSLLIVQSRTKTSDRIFWFYYNLTDGLSYPFVLPDSLCKHQIPQISVSSQGLGSHIVCMFCSFQYECYSIFGNGDPNSSKLDYTDYSKFRVPLVLLSLGIVIFISVTRGKKSQAKSLSEEKEEEMFLKQLERKDKNLYQQLNKTRKSATIGSIKQPRPRTNQFNRSSDEGQVEQRMGNARMKYN